MRRGGAPDMFDELVDAAIEIGAQAVQVLGPDAAALWTQEFRECVAGDAGRQGDFLEGDPALVAELLVGDPLPELESEHGGHLASISPNARFYVRPGKNISSLGRHPGDTRTPSTPGR